jgi:hypothetical protein
MDLYYLLFQPSLSLSLLIESESKEATLRRSVAYYALNYYQYLLFFEQITLSSTLSYELPSVDDFISVDTLRRIDHLILRLTQAQEVGLKYL